MIDYSKYLYSIINGLDSSWENDLVQRAPFPIAYILHKAQEENYDLQTISCDVLTIILKYLALLSINEYLQSDTEPDFDLNDKLKESLTRGVSEGKWLELYRSCLSVLKGKLKIRELEEVFTTLEESKDFLIRYEFYKWEKSEPKGLLSTLVEIRNKIIHVSSLDKKERRELAENYLALLRVALYVMEPLFSYEYCQKIETKTEKAFYRLKGLRNFKKIEFPIDLPEEIQNFIYDPKREEIKLVMFPLTLAERERGSLEELGELYLLNYIKKSAPVYEGLKVGERYKREYLKDVINHFNNKKVFESREDVKLESLENYAQKRGIQLIDELKKSNIYDPDKYVRRENLENKLWAFLNSEKTIFLIFGEAGCGKTNSLAYFAEKEIKNGNIVLFYRCQSLSPILADAGKLEQLITSELGYPGNLKEILNYLEKKGKKLIIIFDGLNEFQWISEKVDSSHLYIAINRLAENLSNFHSFKIIISTRIESKLYMLKEDESLYSFAKEYLYYFDEEAQKPFYELKNFSAQELDLAFKKFNLGDDLKEILNKDKKGVLNNPFNFKLFAENAKRGVKIKKISEEEIIKNNIKVKIENRKEIISFLDSLIRAMDRLRDMNPTLDKLEKKESNLHKKLTENNWEIANKLENYGFLKLYDVKGEKGISEKIINFNHDKIFKYLHKKLFIKYILLSSISIFLFASFILSLGYLANLNFKSMNNFIKDVLLISRDISIILFFIWMFEFILSLYFQNKGSKKYDIRFFYMMSTSSIEQLTKLYTRATPMLLFGYGLLVCYLIYQEIFFVILGIFIWFPLYIYVIYYDPKKIPEFENRSLKNVSIKDLIDDARKWYKELVRLMFTVKSDDIKKLFYSRKAQACYLNYLIYSIKYRIISMIEMVIIFYLIALKLTKFLENNMNSSQQIKIDYTNIEIFIFLNMSTLYFIFEIIKIKKLFDKKRIIENNLNN